MNANIVIILIVLICVGLYMLNNKKHETFTGEMHIPDEVVLKFIEGNFDSPEFKKKKIEMNKNLDPEQQILITSSKINQKLISQNLDLHNINREIDKLIALDIPVDQLEKKCA